LQDCDIDIRKSVSVVLVLVVVIAAFPAFAIVAVIAAKQVKRSSYRGTSQKRT
jgi:hypothetical protein